MIVQLNLSKVLARAALLLAALLSTPTPARSEPTTLTVRVVAEDGKFIGDAMGGVRVTVLDADTGEVLQEGITRGGTGDTRALVVAPRERRASVARSQDASFTTILDIARPRRITIEAKGPRFAPQAEAGASKTLWVMPGMSPHGDDGVILELSGLAVQILSPAVYERGLGSAQVVRLEASVLLLCGCGLEPGGLWDADEYEIGFTVRRDGETHTAGSLSYAGSTSRFTGSFTTSGPGVYELEVVAYNPVTGSAGVDHASVVVQ